MPKFAFFELETSNFGYCDGTAMFFSFFLFLDWIAYLNELIAVKKLVKEAGLLKPWLLPKFHAFISRNKDFGIMVPAFY
jgi:hypothetical protein